MNTHYVIVLLKADRLICFFFFYIFLFNQVFISKMRHWIEAFFKKSLLNRREGKELHFVCEVFFSSSSSSRCAILADETHREISYRTIGVSYSMIVILNEKKTDRQIERENEGERDIIVDKEQEGEKRL